MQLERLSWRAHLFAAVVARNPAEYFADPSFESVLYGPDTRNDLEMRARLSGSSS